MIPKVIHYCWFGRNPLPKLAIKCIESWKMYAPDFEIIEWNESNFDIHCNKYVEQAYECKKWAFVSDYARLKVLYENGGVYFDTDVKMIRPINDIVENGNFLAMELPSGTVAMGLGFGVTPKNALLKEFLDFFDKKTFLDEDGNRDMTTIVQTVSQRLSLDPSFKKMNLLQNCLGFTIYPTEYFCPYNYETGKMLVTKNTRCVHLYDGSWLDGQRTDVEIRKSYIQWGYKNLFTKVLHKLYAKIISMTMRYS